MLAALSRCGFYWETLFLPLLVLTRRGAIPVKTSNGNQFPRKYQRGSQKLLPALARNSVKFLTFSIVSVIFRLCFTQKKNSKSYAFNVWSRSLTFSRESGGRVHTSVLSPADDVHGRVCSRGVESSKGCLSCQAHKTFTQNPLDRGQSRKIRFSKFPASGPKRI